MKRLLTACLLVSLALAQSPAPQPAPVPLPSLNDAKAPEIASLPDANSIIARWFTRLRDWPQLGRYRDQNTQVAAPEAREKRVVFMGDSITDGWKLADYFPGKPYVNRGISGQTTPQMLIRMMPDVIELAPRAMVVLAGTNDIASNTGPVDVKDIERNYQAMAELARAHKIAVVFSSVLPVHDQGNRGLQTPRRSPEKIRQLNDWLKQYCAQNKLVYLDYYSNMLGPDGMLRTELAADGLHPNADGYKIMAPLAEAAITKALK